MSLISHAAKFPDFSKLSIEHKHYVNQITSKFEPYSDFNFTSLFCWNIDEEVGLSNLNDNLVIRLPDYLNKSTIYSILGNTKIDESLNELLRLTEKIKLVPQPTIDSIKDKSKYNVIEDRDGFDYIYNLHDLKQLAGGRYKKKRNKHNSFVKDHESFELEVKVVRTMSPKHYQELKDVTSKWEQQTSKDHGDIVNERAAIHKLLDNFNYLDLSVIEVFVDNDLKGFSINEVVNHEYAICHFEKALKTYHASIYTFLASQAAKKTHGAWMQKR